MVLAQIPHEFFDDEFHELFLAAHKIGCVLLEREFERHKVEAQHPFFPPFLVGFIGIGLDFAMMWLLSSLSLVEIQRMLCRMTHAAQPLD